MLLTFVERAKNSLANSISSSTGMARKNSTTAAAGTRTHRWSDIRAMPSTAPSGRAMIMARAAALSVSPRPGSRYVVQASDSVNGFQRDHSSWPLSSIVR